MTISSLAPTTNPGGGKIPRKRSWGQSLKKGVITGAVVGGSCASIVIAMGTWGDYPTRELVKTQARMFFAPDHVFEAKVLRGGKQDPAWLCWGPGHPAHACRPYRPDPDMAPECIEPMSSIPAGARSIVREIYGGTDKWGPPHPCRGLRIAKVSLPGGASQLPREIPEWVMPDPGK